MRTPTYQNKFSTRSAQFDYTTRANVWSSRTSVRELRSKAAKFAPVAISDKGWTAYCRLHELREIGLELQNEEEHDPNFESSKYDEFDRLWNEFNSSPDAGMAYAVQRYVLRVNAWA